MQIHDQDLVQLTLMWDRDDLRRSIQLSCRRAFQSNISVGLAFAALAIVLALDSASYGGDIGLALAAGLCGWLGLRNLANPWLHERKVLRNTSDSRFGPNTYQIDGEGVRWEGPEGHVQLRWLGVTEIERHQHFWRFQAGDNKVIFMPRRTLTDGDEEAVRSVLQHLRSGGHTPAAENALI